MLKNNYLWWIILAIFICIMMYSHNLKLGNIPAIKLFNGGNGNSNENSNRNENGVVSQKKMDEIIRILIRQASRWTTAARQDTNMLITVLHANYGVGYLLALKDIANSVQIKKATGVDILKFEAEVVKTQDLVTRRLSKLCKGFAPKKSYLTQFGGE